MIHHRVLLVFLAVALVTVVKLLSGEEILADGHVSVKRTKETITSLPKQDELGSDSSDDDEPVVLTVYSHARLDRSGAFLQDMLLAHAHAFASGKIYGGCCVSDDHPAPALADVQSVIELLGLSDMLPLACPPSDNDKHHWIMPRQVYYQHDTASWTPAWVEYVRGVVSSRSSLFRNAARPFMAIHMRRGDVTPCAFPNRYLPNQHYLQLIDHYRPTPTTPVYVYSERKSAEPWEDFTNLLDDNVHLQLNTPLTDVWKALVTADVLVLSKSSLSLVAAVLNPHAKNIIYTPFWHEPLSNWTVVGRDVLDDTQREMARLSEELHCLG